MALCGYRAKLIMMCGAFFFFFLNVGGRNLSIHYHAFGNINTVQPAPLSESER